MVPCVLVTYDILPVVFTGTGGIFFINTVITSRSHRIDRKVSKRGGNVLLVKYLTGSQREFTVRTHRLSRDLTPVPWTSDKDCYTNWPQSGVKGVGTSVPHANILVSEEDRYRRTISGLTPKGLFRVVYRVSFKSFIYELLYYLLVVLYLKDSLGSCTVWHSRVIIYELLYYLLLPCFFLPVMQSRVLSHYSKRKCSSVFSLTYEWQVLR